MDACIGCLSYSRKVCDIIPDSDTTCPCMECLIKSMCKEDCKEHTFFVIAYSIYEEKIKLFGEEKYERETIK